MDHQILYYVVPKENFKAEDRVFLNGEKYPVYDKDGRSLLVAENGEFLFTNELMNQAINEWGLEVVEINNIEEPKPCPFCGGKAKIQVCDDEGNLRGEEYKSDPWSGLSYSIVHDDKENKGCPIANFYEDGGVVGTLLYESEEELITAWNKRI